MATLRRIARSWLTLGGTAAVAASALYFLALQGSPGRHGGGAPLLAGGRLARAQTRPPEFSWLRPLGPPQGWRSARLPGGTATLAYPSTWHPIEGDPGSVSAALLDHGRISGYLNATPRSGEETLGNWGHFRPAHNRDEGDRDVVSLGAAGGLRFRSATGSCVIDRYATVSARYREIACIVRGPRATTVVVGAARSQDWAALHEVLERSIASYAS